MNNSCVEKKTYKCRTTLINNLQPYSQLIKVENPLATAPTLLQTNENPYLYTTFDLQPYNYTP